MYELKKSVLKPEQHVLTERITDNYRESMCHISLRDATNAKSIYKK